jgi:hypothetical protein
MSEVRADGGPSGFSEARRNVQEDHHHRLSDVWPDAYLVMMKYWVHQSWLGWLNFLFFQWFFLRVFPIYESKTGDRMVASIWMTGIVPMTGWWSNYRSLWLRGHVWPKRKVTLRVGK